MGFHKIIVGLRETLQATPIVQTGEKQWCPVDFPLNQSLHRNKPVDFPCMYIYIYIYLVGGFNQDLEKY